jgi:hypothetical protein
VDHPQLGAVEIGGIAYMRTVRNPPQALLAGECGKVLVMVERLRAALPSVTAGLCLHARGDHTTVELTCTNQGFLSTASLQRAEAIEAAPPVSVELELDGPILVEGTARTTLPHLEGWGGTHHPLYPQLPARSQSVRARWLVQGEGSVTVRWTAGRAGRGSTSAEIKGER